jgi:hypothetical protein
MPCFGCLFEAVGVSQSVARTGVPEHKMQRERKHKMLIIRKSLGILYHGGVSAENLSSDDLGHEM